MENEKKITWILRIAMFATFLGHGILAVMQKKHFIDMFVGMGALVGWTVPTATASSFVLWIGVLDILVAVAILWKPLRVFLIWGVFWAFMTAVARPLATHGWNFGIAFTDPNSDGMMDFVERFGNFLVPLALLYIRGFPKTFKEWFE